MARTGTSGVETACPNCGHGPIASDAERCPSCFMPLRRANVLDRHNDRELDPLDEGIGGGTRIGGLDLLTSDAEAHPGSMAAALAVLGLFSGAVALGLVPLPGDANGYLVLAAADFGLAIALYSMPAFARPLVIVSSPLQVAMWIWQARDVMPSARIAAVAALPLLILAGVTGATGPRRRSLVLATVLSVTAFVSAALVLERRGPGLRIEAPSAGLSLALPAGYRAVHQPEELASYLPIPGIDARLPSFGFADPVRGVGGFWSVTSPGKITPGRLAQAVAVQLDGDRGVAHPVREDLQAMSSLAQAAWEIPLGGGRVASATALRLPDDRTALLVVSAPRTQLAAVRQDLARGASFGKPGDQR